MIKNWQANAVKKMALDEIAANGAIVGKFMETDARRRLEAIREPAWGAGYRNEIVSRLLTNEVEQRTNDVLIRVGVKVGASGYHHGFYIETGSSTAPAQPFLRPALFENKQAILALLAGR
jgi:HK97 gp10 family phage protein